MRIEKKEKKEEKFYDVVLKESVRLPETGIILEKGETIRIPFPGTPEELEEALNFSKEEKK